MELFKAAQQEILHALNAVAGIVEKRHTVPILANVLIRGDENGQCEWITSDFETQMRKSSQLINTDEQHSFATTVSCKKLQDILRTINQEQQISLQAQDNKIILRAGKSRFTLQTLPAEDFPLMKETGNYHTSFVIAQKTLKNLLQHTAFSMATQDIRHYLNGLLLQTDGQKLVLVATDGHRLAYTDTQIEQDLPKQDFILPRKTVFELLRLLREDGEDLIEISFASNQVRFKMQGLEFFSKLIEGKFPDYHRVIPKNHSHTATLSASGLQAALQRTAIMVNEKFKGSRLIFSAGTLQVSSNNTDQEEASDEVDMDYQGPNFEIGFNVAYLQEMLTATNCEMVAIHLADSNSSALLGIPGDDNFKYVVMPMRI